jgi:Xaa-Pro aminopeptidase
MIFNNLASKEKSVVYSTELNTPKTELQHRIAKLQQHLRTKSIDAALIVQNVDLFYFSGTIQQAHLYVPADGDPLLMVYKSFARAAVESALDHIVRLSSPGKIPEILKRNGYSLPKTLGLELDVLPANLFINYQEIFARSQILDLSYGIRMIRTVKSDHELKILRQAAALSDQIAACVPRFLREGMTELELAGRIEAEARKMGHQGIIRMRLWGSEMFYGHLMAGSTGAIPSYLSSPTGGRGANPAVAQGPSFKTVQRHEPVLVDYVFAYNGYLSDHARIFALGKIPDELMRAHSAMLSIQNMIKLSAKPGVASGEIYDDALKKTQALGYGNYFMGVGPERIRFVGHGIGLEVDEFPFLAAGQKLKLQEGMVIAVEPKLVFPGKGVVGIENIHVVTRDGLEQLSGFNEEICII